MGWFSDNLSSSAVGDALLGFVDSLLDGCHPRARIPKSVRVPDLVGKSMSEAREICFHVGVKITTAGAHPSSRGMGSVAQQNISCGTIVPRSSTIVVRLVFGDADEAEHRDLGQTP